VRQAMNWGCRVAALTAFTLTLATGTPWGSASAGPLPLRDGRYANVQAPCATAPMSVRAVIAHGSPMYSPQFGDCTAQITKIGAGIYRVHPTCTADQPPVDTYTITSSTRFSVQNAYGRWNYRWCSKL
jgi:hypothetical protein